MQRHIRAFLPIALAVAFADFCIATARADEVTDWNQIMFQAALVAKTSPLDMSRNAAIVRAPFMTRSTASTAAILPSMSSLRLRGERRHALPPFKRLMRAS